MKTLDEIKESQWDNLWEAIKEIYYEHGHSEYERGKRVKEKELKAEIQKTRNENMLEWRDFFKECGVMDIVGVDRKKLIIEKIKETKQ